MADTEQSRVHRVQVGDHVQFNNLNEDSAHPVGVLEGVVTAFGNIELTYLVVTTEDGTEYTLTEDELHRTGA